jgi:hypothetical protein
VDGNVNYEAVCGLRGCSPPWNDLMGTSTLNSSYLSPACIGKETEDESMPSVEA